MSLRHTERLHQNRGSRITTHPSIEPVSVVEMQEHLKIDGDDDNLFLVSAIEEAREEIENLTGLALITQSWQMTIDRWPGGRDQWWDGVREGHMGELYSNNSRQSLELPKYPLQSITSVTVYDEDGVSTAVTVADVFDVDSQQMPGRITLQPGASWPTATQSNNAIEIVYVAGYGVAAVDVPMPLKRAIKNIAAYLCNHRGDGCGMDDAISASGAASTVERYRVRRV